MHYIKNLYEKKPILVKKAVQKLFNIKKFEDVIELNPGEEILGENDIMFDLVDRENKTITEIVLEDFAICYGLNYLEMSDRRLQEYLKFMARIYGNEYLQAFHNYRAEERKELVGEFNAITYAIEGKLAEAINSLNKKGDTKTL